MYWFTTKIQKTGAVILVVLSCVTAFDEANEDKTLNLKIGFDLTQEKNGAPSLRIRNFEEVPEFRGRKLKDDKKNKRSVRAESSSGSDETVNEKIVPNAKEVRESDASDDIDTSGSDDDRRLSTKGISPDEFEPERSPNVHGRYKGSDTE